MAAFHSHTCVVCGHDFQCTGPRVDNYDGIPPVYCGAIPPDIDAFCEDCLDQGLCDSGQADDCKKVGDRRMRVDYLNESIWVCAACEKWEQENGLSYAG